MNTVIISSCIYGSNPRYLNKALNAAIHQLKLMKLIINRPMEMWVYHDNTVPTAVLKKLEAHAKLIDMTSYGYVGDRRTLWRFHALATSNRVILFDLDLADSLLMMQKTKTHLCKTLSPLPSSGCKIYAWRPQWKHQQRSCIPAGLTCILQSKCNPSIVERIHHYCKNIKNLSHISLPSRKSRYANGYGLDEWWLTFYLCKIVKPFKVHFTNFAKIR